MFSETVQALVGLIEHKDRCTAAHTWRVILYARAVAEYFGADEATLVRVTNAAALHDVGKIDIPRHILQKPGRLTDAEFEVMKTHTARGHERLVQMGETDTLILELVRHHHERVDGAGYPDGLSGVAIPTPARHFAVIDSFDAMTSVRPYRHDVGHDAAERAMHELFSGIGTRYSAESVEAFEGLYRRGELDFILSYCNDASELPGLFDEGNIRLVIEAKR